jgi:general secretion pathway protein F
MGQFAYKALDAQGRFVSGELTAPTTATAVQQLVELGYVPLATEAARGDSEGFWDRLQASIPKRDVTVFLQDLALLLRAGLPLDDSLRLLTENASAPMVRLINRLRASIGAGGTFAGALQSHPATNLPDLLAVIRSAEATGSLEQALETIAKERVKQEELASRIRAAIRYPAFLLFVSGGVLVFFLLFVVPQFAGVVRDFGTRPDALVATVIGISEGLRANGDLIAATAVALLALGLVASRYPRLRSSLTAPLLRLPLVRNVFVLRRTTLLCRSLGTLLGNGVHLTEALRLLADSSAGEAELAIISDRVRRGERLFDALNQTSIVPALAARMLRVGEESGALASVAHRCADYYEGKLSEQVDKLTGFIGPAAIVLISVVIGTLILSVMSTLLSINQIVM